MAHPWFVSSRAARTVWSRTPYRPASAGADRWSQSYSSDLGGGFPGARRESFHISSEPIRDICQESVKKMEAFGVDGGEISRQVHAMTFRVVANVILVRWRNRLMDSDDPLLIMDRSLQALSSCSPRWLERPSSCSMDCFSRFPIYS